MTCCRICESSAHVFASARVLESYDVEYFRCVQCGFIQTEEPYWLDEAYAEAINRADVGLFRRNARQARIVKSVIGTFFRSNGRFIDFGGGYGLLARLMRDAGFDFYRWDAHCENMFAKGFDGRPDGGYELLTAFELFEHLADPVGQVAEMLRYSSNIFFTTELLPPVPPKPAEWWYYGPEHGQHISFYTRKSLYALAEKFSLDLVSDGKSRHLMTCKKVSPFLFNVVSKYKVALIIAALYRRKSLIPRDYRMFSGSPHSGSES